VKAHSLCACLLLFVVAFAASCKKQTPAQRDPLARAYDTEPDWNDAQRMIPLNYQQSQGKRLFYVYCVWCHADATPAGPSNRSNLQPTPALMNDGGVLNGRSDEELVNWITLGGSAMGKSAMMPPYGQTLNKDDIRALVAYIRAIAQPPYSAPAQRAQSEAPR
jgi:cytochrome c oxidase cbb3-type subunit III